MKIETRSSTRVDLAGGTLDLWPLYALLDGCVTINASISIYTSAILEPRGGRAIEIHLRDLKYRRSFENLPDMLACGDPELRLIQKHVAYWRPKDGFYLETFSESPVGGGLGGSSSLSITLIKAFSRWAGQELGITESVTLASNVEAQVLHKMTGTQDYYPALVEGLGAIHYSCAGAKLETIETPQDVWDQSMTLVYTGQPHHSGLNNWQVVKAALENDGPTLEALNELREIAFALYGAVKGGRLGELPALFEREFAARVRLSTAFSSPSIDRLREAALRAGAEAVKICGAGGGGCVLVWSRPHRKSDVEKGCRAAGFNVLNAKLVGAKPGPKNA